ncbi:nitroreductase [Dysgonomonas sp. PH5-45]|uniref:nitroreductase family protein n=1 Tax=unclassified Dysgonomonas TaxID=2630389 RepID=UPI002476563D|nr:MULTISPECIES: nitroreductase family protein [unclassified Dysgonomonas]MDH6354129.1 nitroreductase [Dysgonomonas sp. PH5-45]MDH6387020.1 nitroreductase [Dysgonomonas sp. PH5-37]
MEIKNIVNQANELLKERVSIRKYDPSVKISRQEMKNILQDAMTAPSSFNLQPWRFVVIDSEEGKALIKPHMMFNQLQCETSSAIIAIFGDKENQLSIDPILAANVDYKLMTPEQKEKMAAMMKEYKTGIPDDRATNGIMLDCGFIAMQLMLSAKAYGYDTNPIGGYQKQELSEALGVDTKRYIPVLLISIGKAAEQGKDSVRCSVDEITQWK